MAKNNDVKIRICIYTIFALIFMAFIGYVPIVNSINISNAEKCYAKKDYICAFKSYRNAFSTNIDNEKHVAKYVDTLAKVKKIAVVQEELNSLLNDYPDSPSVSEIEDIFADIREKVKNEYPVTYIDNVVQGVNVIHWNNRDGSIKVYIDSKYAAKIPDYYTKEIKNAFKDYMDATNNKLTFEYTNDISKSQINVVFMPQISGGQCENENESDCSKVMGLTENDVNGSVLTKSTIKLRLKDTDGTAFTKNQIFNIAKHEIGHAIGISGHSYYPEDVMYPVSNDASMSKSSRTLLISRKDFSVRDKQTINLLYEIVPDITDRRYDVAKYPNMFFPVAAIGTKQEIGAKNLEESQKYLNTVDSNYIAQINLAEGYFASKNLDMAEEAYQKAFNYANTNEEKFTVYNNLAVVYYDKKQYEKAVKYADLANGYSKENLADEIKAYCLIELKEYKKAQNIMEHLTRVNPSNATYSAALVNIYFKEYKTISAIKELKRIKKLNPDIVNDDIFKQYKFLLFFV